MVSEKSGGQCAPRIHFLCKPTEDKILEYLDRADYYGIEIVSVQFIGGRDWRIITRHAPIPGPAARRVFHKEREGQRDHEQHTQTQAR